MAWCRSQGLYAWKVQAVANRGFPDVFICSPFTHDSVFIEMKTEKGRSTPLQRLIGEQLTRGGQNHYVCNSLEMAKSVVTSICRKHVQPVKFGNGV